jgi:hypothetical protein
VESPRKGLSDMDVARAAMGQGWPFAAGPWSGDGRREPRRSRGRMSGWPSFWLCPKTVLQVLSFKAGIRS